MDEISRRAGPRSTLPFAAVGPALLPTSAVGPAILSVEESTAKVSEESIAKLRDLLYVRCARHAARHQPVALHWQVPQEQDLDQLSGLWRGLIRVDCNLQDRGCYLNASSAPDGQQATSEKCDVAITWNLEYFTTPSYTYRLSSAGLSTDGKCLTSPYS